MIKPVLHTIILLFTIVSLKAQQNLVPNPSFEEYWECPTAPDNGDGQLEKCKYWYKPNYATSDYMNNCASINSGVSTPSNFIGNQTAFEGNAYISLYFYSQSFSIHSEYIQCKLTEPLTPCVEYYFSMRVSLADYSSYATSTIGMRVDKTPIKKEYGSFDQYDGFELPCNICTKEFIVDTTNWIKISGSFIAEGGEEYLTIGRFIDTTQYSNSNYPIIPFKCDSCFWLDDICYYYVDSVQLIETSFSDIVQKVPNVLTANNDNINDYWYPNNICFSDWKCNIINRWGETIFTFGPSDNGWDGKNNNGRELSEGVYFYEIKSKNNKQTGFIQLVR